jgi:hypothetical protein
VDGDHRSDGRFLEAGACLQAEGAHLNQHSQPSARGCPYAIPRPSCAERGARFGAGSLMADTKRCFVINEGLSEINRACPIPPPRESREQFVSSNGTGNWNRQRYTPSFSGATGPCSARFFVVFPRTGRMINLLRPVRPPGDTGGRSPRCQRPSRLQRNGLGPRSIPARHAIDNGGMPHPRTTRGQGR